MQRSGPKVSPPTLALNHNIWLHMYIRTQPVRSGRQQCPEMSLRTSLVILLHSVFKKEPSHQVKNSSVWADWSQVPELSIKDAISCVTVPIGSTACFGQQRRSVHALLRTLDNCISFCYPESARLRVMVDLGTPVYYCKVDCSLVGKETPFLSLFDLDLITIHNLQFYD